MMTAVREYLLALIAAAFLSAAVSALLPDGPAKNIARTACGLLLVLAAFAPLRKLDAADMARAFSRSTVYSGAVRSGVKTENEALLRDIIKEKCEAYILDKAAMLGLRPSRVTVTVASDGEYPYPDSVQICGKFVASQKDGLCAAIEAELAVPQDRQEWIWE